MAVTRGHELSKSRMFYHSVYEGGPQKGGVVGSLIFHERGLEDVLQAPKGETALKIQQGFAEHWLCVRCVRRGTRTVSPGT